MTGDMQPKVSVLMPVYNADEFLSEAIESVLNQTFRDFELIVIEDGSTDTSADILRTVRDPRLRIIDNGTNLGLIRSLNQGIGLARGQYIARMDADDISLPDRFAKQVAFLDGHPEIAVCGTWFRTIGIHDRIHKHPAKHQDIVEDLLHVGCVIGHPTVMFRKSAVDEIQYESAFEHAEDYRLWARLSSRFKLANLPEVCLLYRTHAEQVSESKAAAQRLAALRIRAFLASSVAPDLSPKERRWVERAFTGEGLFDVEELGSVREALLNLISANASSGRFQQKRYIQLLARVWMLACFRYAINRRRAFRVYLNTSLPLLKAWPSFVRLVSRTLAQRTVARTRQMVRGLIPLRRVIVRISGDLASQMFQYSAGVAVSQMTGLKLVIDTSDFKLFTRHRNLLDGWRLSGQPLTHADAGVIGCELVHQRSVQGDLSSQARSAVGRGRYLVGEWRSHRYFANYREQLQQEFRPIGRPTSQRMSVITDLQNKPSVVILISPANFAVQREGMDMGAWPPSAPDDFYERAMAMIRATEPDVNVMVFISQRNSFHLPSLEKLRPDRVLSVNEQSRDDLYMLTQSKHFIIPASWFGWWAAWLGSSLGKRVIAPKRWRLLAPAATQPDMPGDWELV